MCRGSLKRDEWRALTRKARAIADTHREYRRGDERMVAAEHDVEYLGSGVHRSTYALNGWWVVKVGAKGINLQEARIWDFVNSNDHPARPHLPQTFALQGGRVLIQERINYTAADLNDYAMGWHDEEDDPWMDKETAGDILEHAWETEDLLAEFGIRDMHEHNWGVDDDLTIKVFDFANFYAFGSEAESAARGKKTVSPTSRKKLPA